MRGRGRKDSPASHRVPLEADVGGIDVYGPDPDAKTGIVSFNFVGVHAKDVAEALNSQGIAVREGHHCTLPLHQHLGIAASVRASFYLYNMLEEVHRFGEALRMAKRILMRPGRRP
jgi:cysteine desulfurase/selenocysteine lyase